MSDRTYRTASGRVLADAEIAELADEAERGYDVRQFGDSRKIARASRWTIRVPTELRVRVEQRAEREQTSASEIVRAALRAYLGGD